MLLTLVDNLLTIDSGLESDSGLGRACGNVRLRPHPTLTSSSDSFNESCVEKQKQDLDLRYNSIPSVRVSSSLSDSTRKTSWLLTVNYDCSLYPSKYDPTALRTSAE